MAPARPSAPAGPGEPQGLPARLGQGRRRRRPRHRRRRPAERHRLSGDRRTAAADRALRLDRAARRLRRSSARRGSSSSGPTPPRSPSWPPSSRRCPALAAADRPAVAALLALVVGGYYLGARLLGLGVLSTFLSRPILVGFFAGISLSILVGQLEARHRRRHRGRRAARRPSSSSPATRADPLAVARARRCRCSACSQGVAHLRLPVPGPVVVVVVSRHAVGALRLPRPRHRRRRRHPVEPAAARAPGHGGAALDQLLLGAAAIFLVSFAAGIVTARSFGERGGYPVDADREMVGFGAANIAAGLFCAFPVTASDSRTAINASVGGRSQLASVVAAATLLSRSCSTCSRRSPSCRSPPSAPS